MLLVAIAYLGFTIFLVGTVLRVALWAHAPVPFRIPLSCGQQKSLAGIRGSWLENPWTGAGTFCRMMLEVLAFRSLFRNSRAELLDGPRFVYRADRALWFGALVFHFCLLLVIAGHLRFFIERSVLGPANAFVDAGLLAGLVFLLGRRLIDARLRYLSLATDYAPLALLIAVGATGVMMRYWTHVDILLVKRFALGLATFHPIAADGAGILFSIHVIAASTLVASIPFTKLSHMAGIFFSPARNLPNDSRARLHVNPWRTPARVHTYAEWEDEFRDKIRAAGLPLDRG